MRRANPRDRAAAAFFGLVAGAAVVAGIATSSLVLVAVGVVLVVAAIAAARTYPIDRVW